MWRRSLHDAFGAFDESYQYAGDYEFFLRCLAGGARIKRIDATTGLFYWDAQQLSNVNYYQRDYEYWRAVYRWKGAIHDKFNHP